MSREHLYKAKRVDWEELPKEEWWVEGYLYQNLVKAFIIFSHTGSVRNGLFKKDVNTEFSAYVREVEPDTICEYAGLSDKNGRKIFEKDICKYYNPEDKDGIAIIEEDYVDWIGGTIHEKEILTPLFYLKRGEEWEVIGNIFDNPELLEGDEEE